MADEFPPELPPISLQVSYEEFYRKVQHNHSWSKHRLSKPCISAPPKTGDI
jgi:hypothetical protein